MSTLTRSESTNKPPQYKDYVSFLQSYKNGKKDDQNSVITNDSGVSFSLTNSSNNSSSSVFSDMSLNDGPKNGFKEYLESLNHKKYNPVRPSFIKNSTEEKKISMKSEVFIEIKNPEPPVHGPTKIAEIQTNGSHITNPNTTVSKVSKMFEENNKTTKQVNKVVTINRVNSSPPKENKFRTNSVGEISKRFEEPPKKTQSRVEESKVVPKKAASIDKVSQVFQDPPVSNSFPKSRGSMDKPLQNGGNETTIFITCPMSPKPVTKPKPVFETKEQKPVKPQNINGAFTPKPATPEPKPETKEEKTNETAATSPVPGFCPPPPPPPPLPSANSPVKINTTRTASKPPLSHGSSPQRRNTTDGIKISHDVVDGNNGVSEIDKNDPRVKKLVYGALREMYGAYHDKANDYLSTLPRNRVRKNNGLDSIIDSIASQGGLQKLTGRVNPNAEKE